MEFLEKVGAFFNTLLGTVERLITRLFGSSNERRVRALGFVRDKSGVTRITPGSVLDRINQLEPVLEKLTDDELRQTAPKMRARLAAGETLDDLLPEAFAAVRESGKRYLKMRHYDVQMVGGHILHHGMIAEMVTGEGKTLVSTMPAFLNALSGSVHIVTVNDYLARRDMEWMGPLHLGLGLTVGAIQSNMSPAERQVAYACDITYGTNNEFGFDYLRDNMKPTRNQQVQRGGLHYAIVDEIDNILIDEARTPLIISGPAHDDVSKYPRAHRIALQLKKDVHFEVKEKEHTCHLTDEGVRVAEQLADVESFYTAGNMEWPHLIDNALRAIHLYKRDVNYVVRNGEVIIVDEHTGRMMEGRQWSDGLHQAVEAKEGVRIKEESQTLATITLQNFFKMYKKLSGMTGTAMTEANEFWKIYKLDVTAVPTNRPTQRINFTDAIYRTLDEKWNAVIQEVKEVATTGRPVLVGTVSIESSELLSHKLTRVGVPHAVLNAKHHEREAEIIAQAGRKGAVTIATNMAGRGTDIILGGNPEYLAWDELKQTYATRLEVPKQVWDDTTKRIAVAEGMVSEGREVAQLGGLHVVGTERHDSRRIDLQLRGRAGRQGDPGSSRFFLSLEDDLMRKFAGDWVRNMLANLGMEEGERIESRMVMSQIEGAQKKVEERHFEMRKHLLEYDEVMDEQRKRVYSYRQAILDGANCRELILQMMDRQIDRSVRHFLSPRYRWDNVAAWASQKLGFEIDGADLKGMDYEQLVDHLTGVAERQADLDIQERMAENLPEEVEHESERNWQAMSKWANSRFGLNTNDRELKKIGLEELQPYLYARAKEGIARYDFTPMRDLLDAEWPAKSLAAWASTQYDTKLTYEEFLGIEPAAAAQKIREQITEEYQDKDVEFPVSVGMNNFLGGNSNAARNDRLGLVRWANGRFQAHLNEVSVEASSRQDLLEELFKLSERFLARGKDIATLDDKLDQVYGPADIKGATSPPNAGALVQLAEWVSRLCDCEWTAGDLESLSRDEARQQILQQYELRYRPELHQSERLLLLDVLDTAWKDHLYFMDHLRSGIGLVGYAQKDPKVEYRREGMRTFEQMWERIADQVTSAIFRLENFNPEFVGSLWQITSTTHASPPTAEADDYSYSSGAESAEPSSNGAAGSASVDPIRNSGPRVGRNDPCPCGSGKKYKKCHGQNS